MEPRAVRGHDCTMTATTTGQASAPGGNGRRDAPSTAPDATAGASTGADGVLLPCQVQAEGQDVPPTVHFQRVGKRPGRRSLPAMSIGQYGSLLFVTDAESGRRFLCDPGARS